jgi:L-fuconolactonase
MNVDAHQHFWQYDAQRDAWITDEMAVLQRDFMPADLLPQLAANNIGACIAVQADQSERETQFLLGLAAQNPAISGVVGWVDLCAANVAKRLEYFSQFEKLCGFRHVAQSEPDDNFLLREDFLRGIAALSEFDFAYDVLIYPRQLPAAIGLVERFPRQRFIVDHIAKPEIKSGRISPWDAHMRALAAHPNVYCKVSGMITEADWENWRAEDFRPYLDVVFDAFGPDRLIFGSDWPVCLLAGTYSRVKHLLDDYVRHFSAEANCKIFGSNAIEFYGLRVEDLRVASLREKS